MKRVYSLYEAKAKLSEIIRQVRERRQSVTVSYRGRPVAEIRPIDERADATALERRLGELAARGAISPPTDRAVELRAIAKRPGALARFLEERD